MSNEDKDISPARIANNSVAIPMEDQQVVIAMKHQMELQAAITIAKKFPRDEMQGYADMRVCFAQPEEAMVATYNYERGTNTISGPSIKAARALAQCWGNIDCGLQIIAESDDKVTIEGYAYDLQRNLRIRAQDEFKKQVYRKARGWVSVKNDDRELRELINRKGAILVRNCLLQILPKKLVNDAVAVAQATVKKIVAKEFKQDRPGMIRALVVAFNTIGIQAKILERKLCHPIAAITDAEYTDMRGILTSLSEGNTTPTDHFQFDTSEDVVSQDAADLTEQLKDIAGGLKTGDELVQKEKGNKVQQQKS